MSTDWHPRATKVEPIPARGGTFVAGFPTRFVLHTTEGDSYSPNNANYFGSQSWPHFTITASRIYQHLPISRAAMALMHPAGTVETNNARAIQAEIVGRATNAPNFADALLDNVADVLRWVSEETFLDLGKWATFHSDKEGVTIASARSPFRLTAEQWRTFDGVCGHQHVPNNDHWDPGFIPVSKLQDRLRRGDAVDMATPAEIIIATIDQHADFRLRDTLNAIKGLDARLTALADYVSKLPTTSSVVDLDKLSALIAADLAARLAQ